RGRGQGLDIEAMTMGSTQRMVMKGLLLAALLAAAGSCGGGSTPSSTPDPQPLDIRRELENRLQTELAQLGIDPQVAAFRAPAGEASQVFDLAVEQTDSAATGHTLLLSWTEMLAGDADLSGTVDNADLDAVAAWHAAS